MLIALFGVGLIAGGLIAGGVFLADPSLGFPAGALTGAPAESSWHATVHSIAPGLALDAVIVACFVVARRFVGLGQRAWVGTAWRRVWRF